MITSTRRVSPDKSEVRIAFSLEDTSGNRTLINTHTHTHTLLCSAALLALTSHTEALAHTSVKIQLILSFVAPITRLTRWTPGAAWSSTLTAFAVCVEHMRCIPATKTDQRPPPPLTLCSFFYAVAETGAPSISVEPQHKNSPHTHVRSRAQRTRVWTLKQFACRTRMIHFCWSTLPMVKVVSVRMFYCSGGARHWDSSCSHGRVRFPPLILTVSHCLIHCSAFRTLAYIYMQLTRSVILRPSLIPLVFLGGSEMKGCGRNDTRIPL